MPPRYEKGDIWLYAPEHWIGVPTNVGWNSAGVGILGAGLAKDAKNRYPGIEEYWGAYCTREADNTRCLLIEEHKLVLIPTKGLNWKQPHLSWKNYSTIGVIERSLQDLVANNTGFPVALPWLGCGHGGLTEDQVKPLFDKYLDANYVIVSYFLDDKESSWYNSNFFS